MILNGAEIGEGCTLRDCIVAAGCRVGARTQITRRRGARRGRDRRGGQRDHARGAYLPWCRRCPTARSSSRLRTPMPLLTALHRCPCPHRNRRRAADERRRHRRPHRRGALARGDRPRRPLRPAGRRARAARAPARRAVAGGVGDHGGLGHPGRARRRRHGRLGDRRRAGARRARRPRLAADLRDARLRPAAVDDARHDGAVRELLGQHRGDARLLRVGRARSARSARSSPPAGAWPRWRARTACP